MTVIVAAQHKRGVVIAADSETTWGWEKERNTESKLWTADPYVFGGAGGVRTIQVVRYHAAWPKFRADEVTDVTRFAVTEIVPAIFNATKDRNVERDSHGLKHLEASFVVAWGEHVTSIAGDGSVVMPVSGRCAVGSGSAEALGFLGDDGPWSIKEVVEAARRATISAVGCAGPIDYVTTWDREVKRAAS